MFVENFKKSITGVAAVSAMLAGSISMNAYAWEPTKPIDFVIMAGAGGGLL